MKEWVKRKGREKERANYIRGRTNNQRSTVNVFWVCVCVFVCLCVWLLVAIEIATYSYWLLDIETKHKCLGLRMENGDPSIVLENNVKH